MKTSEFIPPYEIIGGSYGFVEPEGVYRPLDFQDGELVALTPETVALRLQNQSNVSLFEMRGARNGKGEQGYHLTYRKQQELAKLTDHVRFDRSL